MQAFEGIRVLDLTHIFAGPFSTYQLAVMGAEVIKIEPVEAGDIMRYVGPIEELNEMGMGLGFQAQASNKKSLAIDLKSTVGRHIFHRLVATADVVVQNFTSGCLAELGLDAESLIAIKPDLIYCSISGYGRNGSKGHHPAYDIVIQAFTGVMCANGEPNSAPVRVGPAMIDYGTGAQAAFAISAALYRRQVSGEGAVIDVAMADAALMLLNYHVVSTIATGKAPRPHGNQDPDLAAYSAYPTSDGDIMLGAYTPKQAANLMRVLGYEHEATEIKRLPLSALSARRQEDAKLIAAALLKQSAERWEQLLNEAHVPAARIRPIEEVLNHPQIQSRQVLQRSNDEVKPTPVAGFDYDQGGPKLVAPPPAHGADTQTLLKELGFSVEQQQKWLDEGVVKQAQK
jgi:crotonobetainyl-CoA:carnitine CoA-transferase CaiB-like acyl-CoA transferase